MTNHKFVVPEAVTDCFFVTFSLLNQLRTFVNYFVFEFKILIQLFVGLSNAIALHVSISMK